MTANEIRNMEVGSGKNVGEWQTNELLREIAAQLAEQNEILRDNQNRSRVIVEKAMQFADMVSKRLFL